MHLQQVVYMESDFLCSAVIFLSLFEEIQAETSLCLTILFKKWK